MPVACPWASAQPKTLARAVEVLERDERERYAAGRADHAPAMVAIGEGVIAGTTQAEGVLVLAHAVRAHAGATQRIAGAASIADDLEAAIRLHVEAHRLCVVTFYIREQPELAQREREHQRLAPLLCDLVARLERRPRRFEIVLQEPYEPEPRERRALGPAIAGCMRDADTFLKERRRLRVFVEIAGSRPHGEEARSKLSLQRPRAELGDDRAAPAHPAAGRRRWQPRSRLARRAH